VFITLIKLAAKRIIFLVSMLMVVGTELLVSTQAAQTTKNHKLMIVTYV
jgi:hypothetical protein